MIVQLKHFKVILLLVLAAFSLPAVSFAEEAEQKTSPLFNFQQKLALKGNPRAQYKLACMYEAGKGVMLDVDKAKHWYDKASKEGMKAAGDRYTYLIVKQQGYDAAAHSVWLDGIKADAKAKTGEAMFLLGQLYREGIGVKKDLNKSLNLFEQVSLSGDADIDEEIEMIQAEIASNRASSKARTAAKKQRDAEAARLALIQKKQNAGAALPAAASQAPPQAKPQQPPLSKKQPAASKEQKQKQVADAKSQKQAEKIRRYERAMMKLKLEQKQIDEQQAWASGGTEADDEI